MNNIIYQTKKIRVEKIYREEEDDKTRETKLHIIKGIPRYRFHLLSGYLINGSVQAFQH